jgi:hypothetical protein
LAVPLLSWFLAAGLAVPAHADDNAAPDVAESIEAVVTLEDVADETVIDSESPADIPTDPTAQPISFDDLPVKVSIAADEGAQSRPADGLTVIEGAGEQASAVVQPTESGVRFMTVIDGATAATEYSYRMELTDGASVTHLNNGAFAIVDAHGLPVGGISAPWAVDANGVGLPTSYSLEGSTLTQHVDLSAATAFPVVADPSYDSYGKLNGAEKSFCRWPSRWLICNTAGEDANTSLSAAKRLFPENTLHNGRGDAFRHCYWSALMTIHMGAGEAAGFGDRHEDVGSNPYLERVMDQRNNAVGRDQVAPKTGVWKREMKAESQCASKARAGQLWKVKATYLTAS